MNYLGHIIQVAIDLIFYPLGLISPWAGLLLASFLTGVIMLLIFKYTSNQAAISAIKDRISAGFLAIRIYRDDTRVIGRALGGLLLSNLAYLRRALAPLAVIIIPAVLIMVNLNGRYGWRPISEGDQFGVYLKGESADKADLAPGPGLEIIAGPVVIKKDAEVDWKLKATGNEPTYLQVTIEGKSEKIDLAVGQDRRRIFNRRGKTGIADAFLEPGPPLTIDDNLSLEIEYPARSMKIGGYEIHWLITFLIVSIIGGYALKGRFKVEI